MRFIHYVLLPFIMSLHIFVSLPPASADVTPPKTDTILIKQCDFLTFRLAVMKANRTNQDISFACDGIIHFTHQMHIRGDFKIDGASNITLDGGKKTRLFYIHAGALLVLEGVVVQNGYNDGSFENTVTNVVFRTSFGGAIQNDGDLTLIGCFFTHNSVLASNPNYSGYGGAISNSGKLTIIRSRFTHNSANRGGVILNNGSTFFYPITNDHIPNGRVIIRNSLFSDNRAISGGAVVYNFTTRTASPDDIGQGSFSSNWAINQVANTDVLPNIIYNSTFYRNDWVVYSTGRFEVYGSKFMGNRGGLGNESGLMIVYGNEFKQNGSAINNGRGVLYAHHNLIAQSHRIAVHNHGIALLTHNVLVHNRAQRNDLLSSASFGCAIHNIEFKLTLRNSIVSGNCNPNGGGAIYNGGQFLISDSIIRNNARTGYGIFQYSHIMSQVVSKNTRFINNTCIGMFIDWGGNISEGASGCSGETPPPRDITLTVCDFASLQSAIAEANYTSGTITITCHEPIIFTEKLLIQHDVTIIGAENAILDGGNMTRLFDITQAGKLTLIGITVQNGFSHDPEIGIREYSINSGLWVLASVGRDFQSTSGTIHNEGILTIINCIFRDNHVIGYGGAIGNENILIIQDSQFINNSLAPVGAGLRPAIRAYGGAIANYKGSDVTITNSVFMNNSTLDGGGAIYNEGTLTITHSLFSHNVASWGGAIVNFEAMTITDSIFTSNTALREGDAIYNLFNGITTSQNTDYVNDDCSSTYSGIFTDGGGNIAKNAYGCPAQEMFDWTDVIPQDVRIIKECHFMPLRRALDFANQHGGEITFTCNGTLYFTAPLTITGDVHINGGENVIFDGDGQAFFRIAPQAKLRLSNLTLEGGVGNSLSNDRATISNEGNLSLVNIIFTQNNGSTSGNIHNTATLMIIDSTFANNMGYDGAVLYNTDGGTVSIINSTFSNNNASHWGDVIINEPDSLIMILNSTFSDVSTYQGRSSIYNHDGTIISQNSTYTNMLCYGVGIIDAGGNTEAATSGCIAPSR